MDHNPHNTNGFEPVLNTQFTGKTLVVEDSRTNQKLITILLQKLGFEVEIAENGQEAVDKVADNNFDLIFMDMQMPIMNGYEATKILRERNVYTPIIALTANAMKGDEEKCLSAGCDSYLSKPINRDHLLVTINTQLQKSSDNINNQLVDAADQIEQLNFMCKQAAETIDNSIPKIDLEAALRTCGDEQVVCKIAQAIVEQGHETFDLLDTAVKEKNAKDILLYAHRLKGNAMTIGASGFAEQAGQVEECGRLEDVQKAASLIADLKSEFDRLISFLSEKDWIDKIK